MNYFYNGKKPSAGYNIASTIFLLIAIAAIIYLITLIDSFEDLEGNYLPLFFIAIMAGSAIYSFFRKKGELHTHRIQIIKNNLVVNSYKVPLEKITLDIYNHKNSFKRYHLWDSSGIISIYSVFEDDLLKDFKNSFIKNINWYEEISSSQDGAYVFVKSKDKQLSYNLEVGNYTITEEDKETNKTIPKFYIYDPKYKKA